MEAGVERMHHDIEVMTRRLELEKRRLQKLSKEHEVASSTYEKRYAALRRGDPKPKALDFRPSTSHGGSVSEEPRDEQAKPPKNGGGSFSRQASGRQASVFGGDKLTPPDAEEGDMQEDVPMRTLVARLDLSTQRLSTMRTNNEVLRKRIDKIRQDRCQVQGIFEGVKGEIRRRTSQLSDVVEETAAGKGVIDAGRQRISVMQKQREVERASFKDQVLRIRKDLQEYDFEKKEVEVQLKKAEHGVQKKRELIVPEEESGWSESSMIRRIMKTAFLNCIQRRHIKQHEKSIAVFEQAFSTIKHSTNISDITEIVKIFMNLESRNYSLLTYANHMNREIETLENARRHRIAEESQRERGSKERDVAREDALGAMRKRLRACKESIAETRDVSMEQQEVVGAVQPLLQQLGKRLLEELAELHGLNFGSTAGGGHGDDLPKLPREVTEDHLPEWLDWIEKALGRFRELIPMPDRAQTPFPATAALRVKQLQPKRMNGALALLVKKEELPNATSLSLDDMPAQKRVGVSALQRAEIADEEEDEEDFADRPLMLKDLKERAEKSAARRRKRLGRHMPELGGPNAPDASARAKAQLGKSHGSTAYEEEVVPQLSGDSKQPGKSAAFNSNALSDAHSSEGSQKGERKGEYTPGAEHKAGISKAVRGKHMLKLREGTAEVNDEQLDQAFLSRYKMTREELQVMADRMGIDLSNLCFLKQEFDQHDADLSGYIDAGELGALLTQLGEALSPEELDGAFGDLDQDGSGEIEFFEFVEWFASD
mmetsp:Transcript_30678/g.91050  ORF Transcript_30678/g.91050 Transcript_30678/m.91050 type:complete len:771 (-) Transcript_30678:158-2470(-)